MSVIADALGSTFDTKAPELRKRMKDWYNQETTSIDDLILGGAPSGAGGSILSVRPPIDSKRVVDVTVITEEILGIPLPPEIIRPGGYDSYQQMVDHLVPQLRDVYTKKLKVKPSPAKPALVE